MTIPQRLFYLEQEIIAVGYGRLRGKVTEEEWRGRSGLLLKRMARLHPRGRTR